MEMTLMPEAFSRWAMAPPQDEHLLLRSRVSLVREWVDWAGSRSS